MKFLLSLLLLPIAQPPRPSAVATTPIAVVVGPKSSLQNVSMSDLRRVYLGEAGRVDRVQGIQVVEFAPIRREFYQRVLDMSEARFKRHWIGLLFAGEATVPPKEFGEVSELRDYLAANPHAIAFVPFDQVAPPLKVVTVDGFRPSSAEYPLK
jgi:hypothetical protein